MVDQARSHEGDIDGSLRDGHLADLRDLLDEPVSQRPLLAALRREQLFDSLVVALISIHRPILPSLPWAPMARAELTHARGPASQSCQGAGDLKASASTPPDPRCRLHRAAQA